MVFQNGDVRVFQYARGQSFLNNAAGRIGRMNDAPAAVPPLAGEVEAHIAGLVSGERDALTYQPVDGGLAMFDDVARRDFIAQTGAGSEGILNVRINRVFPRQNRGNAALRLGAGAIQQRLFCDQSHFFVFGQLDGQRQTRQAATDDQCVKFQQLESLNEDMEWDYNKTAAS